MILSVITCIYKKIHEYVLLYIVLFVVDILLIGNDTDAMLTIKLWLSYQFAMKLGETFYVLGIKLLKDRSKKIIRLHQPLYIDEILERFDADKNNLTQFPF